MTAPKPLSAYRRSELVWHDVTHNTPEWDALRVGKVTSSSLGYVMANFPQPWGEPGERYAAAKALERVTGRKSGDSFSNRHTERGHAEEPIARQLYGCRYFCDVQPGGFFDWGDYGCSPDGLVYDDVLIEVKSAIANIHFGRLLRGAIDSGYRWQCIGNLKFTRRDYLHFVSYCSAFPEPKRLWVHEIKASDFTEQFEQIDQRLELFEARIQYFIDILEAA